MAQHGHCSIHTHSLYMILSTYGSHCHAAWGATRIPRHNAYSNSNASDRWGVTLSRFENLQGTGCRSTGGTAQAGQCVRCPFKISIALQWHGGIPDKRRRVDHSCAHLPIIWIVADLSDTASDKFTSSIGFSGCARPQSRMMHIPTNKG